MAVERLSSSVLFEKKLGDGKKEKSKNEPEKGGSRSLLGSVESKEIPMLGY